VLAPNPGFMTGEGTNQYLVGEVEPLLIDVAPWVEENVRRVTTALAPAGGRLAGILLTHIHPDHVGGAQAAREAMDVPLAVHRSRAGFVFGGHPIVPERLLEHGDEIAYAGGRLRAVHTPGHESGHCCYYDPDRRWLFTGDLILGQGTVVVAPPDGDMIAYLASLRALLALDLSCIYPGHGPAIERPYEKINEYLEHRAMRERQILAALEAGVATIPEIVARLYAEIHPALHGAAALTVRAHLGKLEREGVTREVDGGWRIGS
jgi:glyoxylase-like metal-dependent hydrolase (beta-lactamase superfamily II)